MTPSKQSFVRWAARVVLLLTALYLSFVIFPFEKVRPFNERMILAAELPTARDRLAGFAELAADSRLPSTDRFDAAAAAARQARALGDMLNARSWIETALSLSPPNPDFRENLELEYADLLCALREWAPAIALLSSLTKKTGDPQRRQVARGLWVTALRQSGAIAEAAELLETLLKETDLPDRSATQMQLIECWAELGRRADALALLQEVQTTMDRNDESLRNALAEACRRLQCPEDAMQPNGSP